MQKGYAVVRSQGRIITDTIPKKGSKINVMLEKVTIDCTVDDIHKIEETDERVTI